MKKVRQFLRHPFGDGRINPWTQYEAEKEAWKRDNPQATHQQYEQAIRQIAKRLGI